jgi:hypothetical protein
MIDPLQHLRPIDLERLSVGEVVVGAEHVERCPECAATVQTLKLEARAFTQRRPAAVVVERVRAQRPGPWWSRWWPALAVPLAALLVFVISSGRPDEVRLKGGGFSTLINGDVLLIPGVPVRAGDHLSFIVETQRPAQVLVLDLEADKPVTAFVPFGGRGSVAVPRGRTVLPDGATLDDSPAPEWLVALVCEDAVTLEALVLPAVVTRAPPVVEQPGCQVQVVELTRSPR